MRKHNRLGVSGDMIHQQNRKVPTLIGGQYKVSRKLSGAVELGKVEANLDTSWYFNAENVKYSPSRRQQFLMARILGFSLDSLEKVGPSRYSNISKLRFWP